jgi:hypothetical protein
MAVRTSGVEYAACSGHVRDDARSAAPRVQVGLVLAVLAARQPQSLDAGVRYTTPSGCSHLSPGRGSHYITLGHERCAVPLMQLVHVHSLAG